uniref:Electron transfer flavoprotein subunit alpha n=1 Tax=Stygiella incarcerata TaxID=1712417 RepID=A0A192ZIK4_9EUKA|nr:ETF-alpha [Stygiella incarcerata]
MLSSFLATRFQRTTGGLWRSLSSTAGVSTMLLVDHDNKHLSPTFFSAITASKKLGGEVSMFVAGHKCDSVVEECLSIDGISKVIVASDVLLEHPTAETMTPLLVAAQKQFSFSHILSNHSSFGKNIIPRLGAVLDVQPVADVVEIRAENHFVRPFYAGNALMELKVSEKPVILTIRPTAFEKHAKLDEKKGTVVEKMDFDAPKEAIGSEFVSMKVPEKGGRPDLSTAPIVVAGGRGVGSREKFEWVEKLADKLGAAVGATRAVVDAGGIISNDAQIGQTGKIIAPELYIGVGVSGAIQHVAGIKDSKVIVAINKDPEAPIFQVADFGLVADALKAVPELLEKL